MTEGSRTQLFVIVPAEAAAQSYLAHAAVGCPVAETGVVPRLSACSYATGGVRDARGTRQQAEACRRFEGRIECVIQI